MGASWGQQNRRIDPQEATAFLEGLLIESDAGSGDTVVIGGGPASGKSQLHDQVVARAAELGILTLTAAGAADEQDVDGGVIDQLLACPAAPPELAEQFGTDGTDSADGTGDRIAGLCNALQRLARDRAVLVAVDDLHHVDETSTRLLLRLQRRARSTALLLVLSQSESGNVDALSPFAVQPHQYVQLTPLSVATIAELVVDDASDQLSEHIHELSAGNPLLVTALIDAYRGGGADEGSAYSAAVLQLLHRYDSPLREVAAAIAVLDTDVSAEVVAAVAGVDPTDAETSVGLLAEVGLVAGIRFRPASAAAAVVGGLRGPEKVRLHSRAAEVKHARGLPAAEVARHLVAASVADPEWALPTLVEAAEQVMLDDDVEFATRCLELAASVATARWEQQTISQLLAKITWRVNPAAAAPHLQDHDAATDLVERSDQIALARQSLWFGERDTFERSLAALRADEEALDPRIAAELSLAGYWHYGAEVIATDDADDPWMGTARKLTSLWRTGANEATSACAERILHSCKLSDTSLEALGLAIMALAYDDKSDRAEGWCASLREEAEQRGAATWQAMFDAVGASLALRQGDAVRAAERAERALTTLDGPNWGVAITYPLSTLLAAHTANGAFKAAAAVLRRPLPDAALETLSGVRYLRARGRFHLATNRGLAAISDFQQCKRLLRAWDLDLPLLLPWRTELAEANLRLGNPTLAVELAKQQLGFAAPTDHCSRGAALRVLAYTGDAAARQGMLHRAADAFRTAGDRLELARTMRMLNQLGQAAGRSGGLVRPVHVPQPTRPTPVRPVGRRPAQGGGRSLGPVASVSASSAASSAASGPASGATSSTLSEAELRVAELAADGRTNRQISESLYITVSTVEQHLTRVYRKLGVPGRSALADEFSAPDDER